MSRQRITKTIARRIDNSYHKRLSPFRSLRRFLVGLAVVLTLGWLLVAHLLKGQRLYNPGPVTVAHAMFENNCAACHDNDGKGGISKSISDNACLSCHDAAIHSPAQTSLVSLDAKGAAVRSKDCVVCHVEHRGHDALFASADQHCLKCHDNLAAHTKGGKTALPNVKTSFDIPPAHPSFGRALKPAPTLLWHDPNPIKYDHKLHGEQKKYSTDLKNCVLCHSPQTGGDQKIMAPISYETHCYSCHKLEIGSSTDGKTAVPIEFAHGALKDIRADEESVSRMMTAALAREPDPKARRVKPDRRPGKFVEIPESEWLASQLSKTKDTIGKSQAPAELNIAPLPDTATFEQKMGRYLMFNAPVSCVKCHEAEQGAEGVITKPTTWIAPERKRVPHEMPGNIAAVEASKPAATTMPTTQAVAATQPTGRGSIATQQGRRWFSNSVFDHDPHRMMNCVDCHNQALTSSKTSDVLLPDIQSCTACHHPGGRGTGSAVSNCVNCHIYHDPAASHAPAKKKSIAELTGAK